MYGLMPRAGGYENQPVGLLARFDLVDRLHYIYRTEWTELSENDRAFYSELIAEDASR